MAPRQIAYKLDQSGLATKMVFWENLWKAASCSFKQTGKTLGVFYRISIAENLFEHWLNIYKQQEPYFANT